MPAYPQREERNGSEREGKKDRERGEGERGEEGREERRVEGKSEAQGKFFCLFSVGIYQAV